MTSIKVIFFILCANIVLAQSDVTAEFESFGKINQQDIDWFAETYVQSRINLKAQTDVSVAGATDEIKGSDVKAIYIMLKANIGITFLEDYINMSYEEKESLMTALPPYLRLTENELEIIGINKEKLMIAINILEEES